MHERIKQPNKQKKPKNNTFLRLQKEQEKDIFLHSSANVFLSNK